LTTWRQPGLEVLWDQKDCVRLDGFDEFVDDLLNAAFLEASRPDLDTNKDIFVPGASVLVRTGYNWRDYERCRSRAAPRQKASTVHQFHVGSSRSPLCLA
jgi:hypothetical protein